MANEERIGEYLSVRKSPADPKRRTFRWTVLTNHGDVLGAVQWFPRWRQYCFDPREMTTFNAGCLRDLAVFLDCINCKRREAAKRLRELDPDIKSR